MKRIYFFTVLAIVTLLFLACTKKQESPAASSEWVEITNEQFKSEGMQLGSIETKTFDAIVKCNGSIAPTPNGMANVTAPIAGVISKIHCSNGAFVQQNQALLELSGSEIIDMQRDYAEAAARYKRSNSEYQRIKALFEQKVVAEKEYFAAQSDYKSAEASYHSLQLKLKAAALSTAAIENGEFKSSYTLRAPISGYISGLKANIGSYIDHQTTGIEIADPSQFQLALSVFASDISQLKKGQQVRYSTTGSNEMQQATLSSVGVTVNPDTKSIDCYATLQSHTNSQAIANNVVTAEIITRTEAVQAVPTEALIKSDSNYYLLVVHQKSATNYQFNKQLVEIGRQQNGYTELKSTPPSGQIITKGAYNIVL